MDGRVDGYNIYIYIYIFLYIYIIRITTPMVQQDSNCYI